MTIEINLIKLKDMSCYDNSFKKRKIILKT